MMEQQERDLFDLLLQRTGDAVMAIPTVSWENIEKAVHVKPAKASAKKANN